MTQHTPGPWEARDGIGRWNVTTTTKPRSLNICAVNTDRTEQEANARLIAAAPDMLAALKIARDFIQSLPYEPSIAPSTKAQDAVNDAIAKAESRP